MARAAYPPGSHSLRLCAQAAQPQHPRCPLGLARPRALLLHLPHRRLPLVGEPVGGVPMCALPLPSSATRHGMAGRLVDLGLCSHHLRPRHLVGRPHAQHALQALPPRPQPPAPCPLALVRPPLQRQQHPQQRLPQRPAPRQLHRQQPLQPPPPPQRALPALQRCRWVMHRTVRVAPRSPAAAAPLGWEEGTQATTSTWRAVPHVPCTWQRVVCSVPAAPPFRVMPPPTATHPPRC